MHSHSRLSSLGDESGTQTLLPHAVIVLVSATHRSCLGSWKATERLLGTCCPPYRDPVVGWVRVPVLRRRWMLLKAVSCRWSYFQNLTFIGNAVFMSMDIPDVFLAVNNSLLPSLILLTHDAASFSSLNYWIIFNGKELKLSRSVSSYLFGRTSLHLLNYFAADDSRTQLDIFDIS